MVVIRYFGGTKLGVGGLMNAYKTAAESSLKNLKKIEIFEMRGVTFEFDYHAISSVEKLVSDFDIIVANRVFQERCFVAGEIKKEYETRFKEVTKDLFTVQITLTE